jgi:hypothetical protein
MTRNHTPTDDSGEQQYEYSERFETIGAKAREVLKHDDPGTDCDVSVQVHNQEHDSGTGVTNHLIRTDEEWIAVRTRSESGGGTEVTVTDHGETLELVAPELSRNRIAGRIAGQALDAIDSHETAGRPVQPFTTLVRCDEEIAADLVAEWESGAEQVVGERLHKGLARWTGDTAWVAYRDEAINHEAKCVAARFIKRDVGRDVSDDVEATIRDICRTALLDAASQHRDGRAPHMNYVAEVILRD